VVSLLWDGKVVIDDGALCPGGGLTKKPTPALDELSGIGTAREYVTNSSIRYVHALIETPHRDQDTKVITALETPQQGTALLSRRA
jgi:hypothetical protein